MKYFYKSKFQCKKYVNKYINKNILLTEFISNFFNILLFYFILKNMFEMVNIL